MNHEWRYDLRTPGESLRHLTAEALADTSTPPTAERLRRLDRVPYTVRWEGEGDDALRDRAAAIRRESLADLPSHLARLQVRLEDHGVTVHRAATAAEACEIILGIAREADVRVVAKAKSMVTEEIGLNAHLEAGGIEVIETDLGEHIIQRRHERPSQLITPALHLSATDVERLFDRLDTEEAGEAGETAEPGHADANPGAAGPDPDALAARARRRLRADFERADMGVTGVNFAAADTGTLALLSNEGNIDMVTTHPRVHVAVMGIEKVIPRLADLGLLLPLLSRAGGDREVTAYQTLVTGPRRDGESDGPRRMHVVLLDNGRSRMLDTPVWETLACIRCGNCQMSCPVFKAVGGGHAYGSVYGGPIGAVISPLLGDRRTDTDLPYLSTLCGACGDACPVRIPLPELLLELRVHDRHAAGGAGGVADAVERSGWEAWSRAWSSRLGYRLTVEAARAAGRVVPGALLSRLPLAADWAKGRALPALDKAGSLRRWVRSGAQGASTPDRTGAPASELRSGARTDRRAVQAGAAPAHRAPLPLTPVNRRRAHTDDPAALPPLPPRLPTVADSEAGEPPTGSLDPTARFVEAARGARTDVVEVDTLEAAHAAVREVVADRTVVVDTHPDLAGLTDEPEAFGARSVWEAQVGVSVASAGAASTGTLALTGAPGRARSTGITPGHHVVLLRKSALVATYADLVTRVGSESPAPSWVRLTTGPSRSGDIELQTIYGMHGPKTLTVVLLRDTAR